ncbi:hypothetical protein FH972_024081 [Carpinus fangiana]|uniref:Uncharacterized protein n=1 Tax=Carpinus fangiana TaxID=176857 RepID=A0A5N6KXP5_9ROSI|nr:hypothetical protein FH972_024081 [Carpinus fangiana]
MGAPGANQTILRLVLAVQETAGHRSQLVLEAAGEGPSPSTDRWGTTLHQRTRRQSGLPVPVLVSADPDVVLKLFHHGRPLVHGDLGPHQPRMPKVPVAAQPLRRVSLVERAIGGGGGREKAYQVDQGRDDGVGLDDDDLLLQVVGIHVGRVVAQVLHILSLELPEQLGEDPKLRRGVNELWEHLLYPVPIIAPIVVLDNVSGDGLVPTAVLGVVKMPRLSLSSGSMASITAIQGKSADRRSRRLLLLQTISVTWAGAAVGLRDRVHHLLLLGRRHVRVAELGLVGNGGVDGLSGLLDQRELELVDVLYQLVVVVQRVERRAVAGLAPGAVPLEVRVLHHPEDPAGVLNARLKGRRRHGDDVGAAAELLDRLNRLTFGAPIGVELVDDDLTLNDAA